MIVQAFAAGPSGGGSTRSSSDEPADELRLEELFRKLDVNGDGRIDIHDLSEALHRLKVPQLPGHAQVCSVPPCSTSVSHFGLSQFP